jgi:hypothetical protein
MATLPQNSEHEYPEYKVKLDTLEKFGVSLQPLNSKAPATGKKVSLAGLKARK